MKINIGSFELKEMITILFWTVTGLVTLNLLVPLYQDISLSIQHGLTSGAVEIIKGLLPTFIIIFLQLAMWRICCEAIYIVLRGFQSLYEKSGVNNES